eukprot:1290739-Alexandrium_andersonii.AAC.1
MGTASVDALGVQGAARSALPSARNAETAGPLFAAKSKPRTRTFRLMGVSGTAASSIWNVGPVS